jgi:hypothetical protein
MSASVKMKLMTEGVIGTVTTFMILKRLVTPWKDWDACKLGIIDTEGRKLKDPVTSEERQAWTMFDRLMWKVLRLLRKFIGQSQLMSYFTAAYLIRDSVAPMEKDRLSLLSEGLTAEKQLKLFNMINEMEAAGVSMQGDDLEFSIIKFLPVVEKIMENYSIEEIMG